MGETVRTWVEHGEGSGKPDYQGQLWKASIKSGYNLAHNESFVVFGLFLTDLTSIWPHIQPPLVPGADLHAINGMTGLSLPYTIPAGYTLRILTYWYSFTEIMRGVWYFDGQPVTSAHLETLGIFYEDDVLTIDTQLIDPTGATAHTLDIVWKNVGTKPSEGTFINWCVLAQVGSPPWPKTKTVQCKHCGVTRKVKTETVKVKCKVCGKESWYFPMRRGIGKKK